MIDLIITDPNITNPTWWVGAFEFREPVTTFTDFLVALVCWFGVFCVSRISEEDRNPDLRKFVLFYFLCFAIGMTSAAWLGHGFQAYLTPRFKIIGWALGATGILMLQLMSFQVISNSVKNEFHRVVRALFVIEWLVAVMLMIFSSWGFMITQINSTIGLILIVLPMHLYNWKKLNDIRSRAVILALIYSAIPGFIYSNSISLHRYMNYHDISHVLMAVFMGLMIRALMRFAKRQKSVY